MEQDIVFSIHHAVNEVAKSPKKELTAEDYDLNGGKTVYDLTRGTDDKEKGEKARGFQFKDYAAQAFHHVRELFGYTPEQFLSSWEIDTDKKLEITTARSGSMFYRTKDEKFLFKTILHPEVNVMMDLLKDYHKHIQKNKGTFMVKIYGLFRFQYTSGATGDKCWILIMGNTFPIGIKMDEVYDLKGRMPKPKKAAHERDRVSTGAIKDNEITRTLNIVPEDREFYKAQLVTDITLLMSHDIMDYSLLVGVHKLTEEEKVYKETKLFHKPAVLVVVDSSEVKNNKKERKTKTKDEKKTKSKRSEETSLNPSGNVIQSKSEGELPSPRTSKRRSQKEAVESKSPRGSSSSTKLTKEKEINSGSARNSEGSEIKSKKTDRGERSPRNSARNVERKKSVETSNNNNNNNNSDNKKDEKKEEKKEEKNEEKDEKKDDKKPEELSTSTSTTSTVKTGTDRRDDGTEEGERKKGLVTYKSSRYPLITVSNINLVPKNEELYKKRADKLNEFYIDPNDKASEIFKHGGIFCVGPDGEDEILFIGIIDNLTGYGFNKKVANFCKTKLWKEETLSTVHAEFYKDRFETFMTHVLLGEKCIELTEEEQFEKLRNEQSGQQSHRSLGKEKKKQVTSNDDIKASKSSPDLRQKTDNASL